MTTTKDVLDKYFFQIYEKHKNGDNEMIGVYTFWGDWRKVSKKASIEQLKGETYEATNFYLTWGERGKNNSTFIITLKPHLL